MVELEKEVVEGEECVVLQGRYYSIAEESRGVRDKFWLVRKGENLVYEPAHLTNILFKTSRNGVSCENWGEIFSSKIAKLWGVECVNYYYGKIDCDGKPQMGVMCGSYRDGAVDTEISGLALQNNFYTVPPEQINTVKGFVDAIDFAFGSKLTQRQLQKVKTELLKQALFDYLLAQADRHWLNTTFLIGGKSRGFYVKKAPCYDNGCIAFLKKSDKSVEGVAKAFKSSKAKEELENKLGKYCPMFGVNTALVQVDKSRGGEEDTARLSVITENGETRKNIFVDEMAEEVLTDSHLAEFYMGIRKSFLDEKSPNRFDLSKIVANLKAGGDEPPQFIVDMIDSVVKYQFASFDTRLHEILDEKKKEEEEWRKSDCM